jgi:predicted nucleic acid-binding protein
VAFVDTSFFVARTIGRDSRHADAVAVAAAHGTRSFVTSNLVLGETWTTLLRRLGHRRSVAWLDAVLTAPGLRVASIDAQLEQEAWAWLRLHDERPYSFVDATSFALMRKLRLGEALAFDGDFTAAGFTELRP